MSDSRPGAFEVLQFWFGVRPYRAHQVQTHARLWFGGSRAPEVKPQTDELVRERFGDLARQAANGALKAWESGPRRRLALILLLDQFPRNIHRGRPEAFAQDRRALELALDGMQLGGDATLDPVERIFFYMPLMHAENRDIQDESVAAFIRLRAEAPAELEDFFEASLESAREHRELIARFERFPHRNHILGRENTADERHWLVSKRNDFGQ
ncbi:MAG TPA: DUF924 family protein [Steroidobacteraceae bacterium]|nr:DUF924 family protein [Steroidobacteraceae bacterium]